MRWRRTAGAVCLGMVFGAGGLRGEEEMKIEVFVGPSGGLMLEFAATTSRYYRLGWTADLSAAAWTTAALQLGAEPVGRFVLDRIAFFPDTAFFVVEAVALDDPLDSDGDGIDDVFELRQEGLCPLDPGDAALDFDGDGLNNLAEYRAGTLLHQADTDMDGLSDGEELLGLGSDPHNAADALEYLEEARAAIALHWNLLYTRPLQWDHPAGSPGDLQQLHDALAELSGRFHEPIVP